MDKTLKDYIERTQQRLKEENLNPINPDQHIVIPEQQGEEDRPLNPYSPV